MPAQELKDYYRILELPATATEVEVKKAFRRLAFKYHPDQNPNNQFAAEYFQEVQEAYNVLSIPNTRKKYDHARWLAGMSTRAKEQEVITPEWIMKESNKLNQHMETVDTYRMSHSALFDYFGLLLSDNHMAILKQANDDELNCLIVRELLHATRGLKYMYMQHIANRLRDLVVGVEQGEVLIDKYLKQRRMQHQWDKVKPYVIVLITLFIVSVMYYWGKR